MAIATRLTLRNLILNVKNFTKMFCKGRISFRTYLSSLKDCLEYARKGHL